MSPLQFGWPIALLGFAGLVGLLYWLQHLRVRHRDVVVPTTQFWQEAVRDTQARVFRERFRHPLAFAAIVALAGALWWAASDLQPDDDASGARTVIMVDASRDLLDARDWTQAKQAVIAHVTSQEAAQPEVVVWVGRTHTVLARGEPVALLEERLRSIQPVDAASRIDVWVSDRTETDDAAQRHVFTTRPALLAGLGVDVLPLRAEHAPVIAVTGLGFADNAGGAWQQVDVSVEVVTPSKPDLWQLTLDGAPLDLTVQPASAGDGRWHARIDGVPATGGRLALTVTAGEQHATAALQLPDRSPIRIVVGDAVPQSLRIALAADPGVTTDGVPEVSIGTSDTSLPRITLIDDGRDVPAFAIFGRHVEGTSADALLARFVKQTGMDRIDATAIATRRGRPVNVRLFPADVRRIEVVSTLLGATVNLRDSRSFPLFLSRAVRWLAGRAPMPPAAEAGSVVDGVWVDRSGSHSLASGAPFEALAGDVPLVVPASVASSSLVAATLGWDLPTWLAVLALIGLCVEWWFVRRGRMP